MISVSRSNLLENTIPMSLRQQIPVTDSQWQKFAAEMNEAVNSSHNDQHPCLNRLGIGAMVLGLCGFIAGCTLLSVRQLGNNDHSNYVRTIILLLGCWVLCIAGFVYSVFVQLLNSKLTSDAILYVCKSTSLPGLSSIRYREHYSKRIPGFGSTIRTLRESQSWLEFHCQPKDCEAVGGTSQDASRRDGIVIERVAQLEPQPSRSGDMTK